MVGWRGGWWASKKASKATVHHIGIHWTLKMSKYVKTVVVHLIHKLCYFTIIFFNNWFVKTRVRFVAVDVLKSRMELILSTVFSNNRKSGVKTFSSTCEPCVRQLFICVLIGWRRTTLNLDDDWLKNPAISLDGNLNLKWSRTVVYAAIERLKMSVKNADHQFNRSFVFPRDWLE